MDTGYVHLLDEDDAGAGARRRRRRAPERRVRRRGLRRRPARATRSTATPTSGARRRSSEAGRHARRLPVARPERAGRGRLGRRAMTTIGAEPRPLHRLRAGRDVRPVRADLLARRVPRPARRSSACIGAKHSSLSREAEWERLAVRDEVRPDFRVLTGNDLAIDMVMYGCDYLLGLSTFAPDAFARRDRCWADGRPRLPRAERRCSSTSATSPSGRRCRPTTTTRRCSSSSAAGSADDATRRACPDAPESDRDVLRRHRRPPRIDRVAEPRRIAQVKRLVDARRLRRPPRSRSACRIPVDHEVDPDGPAADARVDPSTARPGRGRSATGSRSCRWRAGTAPPTAGRPTCPAALAALRPSGCGLRVGRGHRRPARRPGQPATSSCSTTRRRVDELRRAAVALLDAGRPGGRPPAHPLGPLRPGPTTSARAAAPPTRTRARPPPRRPSAPASSPTTSSPGSSTPSSTPRVLAGAGRVRVRRRQALPRLPRPRVPQRRRPARPVRRRPRPAAPASSARSSPASASARRAWRSACGSRRSTSRPFRAGADGVGEPGRGEPAPYRYAFGGDGTGLGIDLARDPRAARPARGARHRPASARRPAARTTTRTCSGPPPSRRPTATCRPRTRSSASPGRSPRRPSSTRAHPRPVFVGSGYSYLQEWLPHVGQRVVRGGRRVDRRPRPDGAVVPDAAGRRARRPPARAAQICRTFSDCTTGPRNGMVSGCFPLDPFYKARPERVELAKAKRAARVGARPPHDRLP